MKKYIVFVLLFNTWIVSAFASDALELVKKLTKEEYLITIPKSMNESILNNGGRVQTSAGTYMTGVQRFGDNVIITTEIDYNDFKIALQKSNNMSDHQFDAFIKSQHYKDNMFGINGTEKKFMTNYSCSQPVILEALKKGVIQKYRYLLSTGEYLGQVIVKLSDCNSK